MMFVHKWQNQEGKLYRCSDCGIYGEDRRGTQLCTSPTEKPAFLEDAVRECIKVDLSKTTTMKVLMELEGVSLEQTIEVPSRESLGELAAVCGAIEAEVEHCAMISSMVKDNLVRRMVAGLLTLQEKRS